MESLSPDLDLMSQVSGLFFTPILSSWSFPSASSSAVAATMSNNSTFIIYSTV